MTFHRLIGLGLVGLLVTGPACPAQQIPFRGELELAFTPGDDPGELIGKAIAEAREQILVQAYSFTHKKIADALVAARKRGIDVQVIADQDQTEKIRTSVVRQLAEQGVPVWLDGEHAAAHNKVMIIDAGRPTATVITGSLNFTHAAQYRNAENLLILRRAPELAAAFAENWRRHKPHAHPLRVRP